MSFEFRIFLDKAFIIINDEINSCVEERLEVTREVRQMSTPLKRVGVFSAFAILLEF